MKLVVDVAVAGGGAAGCAAALRLRAAGLRTVVLEALKGTPARFCGEFLSGEASGSLEEMGLLSGLERLGAVPVRGMALHAAGGGVFEMPLAGGGWGLTRQTLDAELKRAVLERGAEFREGVRVTRLSGSPDSGFRLWCGGELVVEARAVIGAWGKRVALDRDLKRKFLDSSSPYVGIKMQYSRPSRHGSIRLYLFPGGHCGFVNVDGDRGTLGVLARAESLRQAGGKPEALIERIRATNPALDSRIGSAEPIQSSLHTIAQVPLTPKEPVWRGVFMAGDAAGMTAPFLGLGVANGLASGVDAADAVRDWLRGSCGHAEAARAYARRQRRRLGLVQRGSFAISRLLCSSGLGDPAVRLLAMFPAAGRAIYQLSRNRAAAG
jgi:menaquinone-9 beta-reductase